MKDLIRDSTIGQQINKLSSGRFLSYADQRSDYSIPERYRLSQSRRESSETTVGDATPPKLEKTASLDGDLTIAPTPATASPEEALTPSNASMRTLVRESVATTTATLEKAECRLRTVAGEKNLEDGSPVCEQFREDKVAAQLHPEIQKPFNPYLVDWDGPNDQDNPKNWSGAKKGFVAFSISLLTFSVYIGSAIYTTSTLGIMEEFGVSQTKATLGLTLYVLAYGIGPMFLTPLQEMASLGRNPVYVYGLAIFVLFNVPIITAPNFSTVLAFRFLTGFVGSPALATGGASMSDIFSGDKLPYMIGVWALGAVAGPILGPVIGGFAAQAMNWRWPIYELMWISGFSAIFLAFLLPETLEANILLKRAQRLRKLTGNPNLHSQSEIDEAAISHKEFIFESLVRPFLIATEPAVLFSNIYMGLIYSIFYLWFEAFPLVFNGIYHMNLGVGSLPFTAFVVSGAITYTVYCLYLRYHLEPRFIREGVLAAEARLEIGLIASFFIPVSLLIFGWTSRASVHWIVPIIAAALYLPGIFLNFQSISMYLSLSYPKHTGSVLAGNDLFRSSMASVFPLFGTAFFKNLGLGPGSSLLAGVSLALIPVYYLLVRYGDKLRARSRYSE